MQRASNQTIYDIIDALAPFDSQEDFDNAGFLIGRRERPVRRVLVALDASQAVVSEAQALKADLLVTHHPVMFHPVKSLDFASPDARLIGALLRAELSLIAAHTNLDRSVLSAGRLIAQDMGLHHVRALEEDPFLVLGDLPEPVSPARLASLVQRSIKGRVRTFGESTAQVRTLAIAGGAYCEGWPAAQASGAQALLTGEVRHHNALAASENGFVLLDGGHYQTERPMVDALCAYLQKQLDALQYEVEVYASAADHGARGYVSEEEA